MRASLLLALCGLLTAAEPRVQGLGVCVTPEDGLVHAVATSQDRVYEISFDARDHADLRLIARIPGAYGAAAWIDPADGHRHFYVATAGGDLFDLSPSADGSFSETSLGNLGRTVDLRVYYGPEDHVAHAIVLDGGGGVQDVWIRGGEEVGRDTLAGYKAPLRIGVLYAPDFRAPALYVSRQDGELHESFFMADRTHTDASAESILDVTDVAATYSPSDQRREVFVAAGDGDLYEVALSPFHGSTTTRLATIPGAMRLAAWIGEANGDRHVLVATAEGALHEVSRGADGKTSDRVVASIGPSSPVLEDIGPNTRQGTLHHGASSAGLMYSLASGGSTLYAVSLNAGVWKSVGGSPWKQLSSSPQFATSITVDPSDPSHLVVGERNGDAKAVWLNHCGAWESRDAGETWKYVFDPLSLPGCTSQAVPAVAVSSAGTVFLGTAAGVGRRKQGAKEFAFSASPEKCGLVGAIATSVRADGAKLVWARAGMRLLLSSDDGETWRLIDIPAVVDGLGTTGLSRGDYFSLAAIGEHAVLLFIADEQTEKTKRDAVGNRNTILFYDAKADHWAAQVTDSGNGTGLGGRRALRSFLLDRPDLPDELGQRTRLLFLGGQDVLSAKGWRKDGTADWQRLALTECGEPGADAIHSDIWDASLTSDGDTLRLACDGGVYQRGPDGKWVSWVEGLHTQHVHTVEILPTGHLSRSRLVFATSDNSEWFRDSSGYGFPAPAWKTWNMTGDANWTASDAGNPALALVVRHAECALLTDFEEAPPEGAQRTRTTYSTICCDQAHFDARSFRFIQSLRGENPPPLLDAVMLAWPPLQVHKEKEMIAVSQGNLANAKSTTGGPLLVRNRRFAANPDANLSQFSKDWTLEASDLPAGTRAVWMAGGHGNPVYYLLSNDPDGAAFYRRDLVNGGWKKLDTVGHLTEGGTYGPIFVNPYDSRVVYALTTEGVRVSGNQGDTYTEEPTLTALLTASGKYPIAGAFGGGNGTDVVLASRANTMGTLAQVAFWRDDSRLVVAASPYTGVFFRVGGAAEWRTLAAYLPRPCAPVASVGIDAEGITVATEGRGLFRIRDYQGAPIATWFDHARLMDGAGKPVIQARVVVRIGDAESDSVTGNDGTLPLPEHKDTVVHLRFEGTDTLAPCESAFKE